MEKFANDWTPESGFANETLKDNKYGSPRPVVGKWIFYSIAIFFLSNLKGKCETIISSIIGTGTNLGLTILLDAGISEYYCSSTNSYGFKFLLHSPNEAPRITNYGTQVSNGYESRVVIAPTLSEATDAIKKLPVNVRQCYFESENYLTYYRYANKMSLSFFLKNHLFITCSLQIFSEPIRAE